MALFFAVGGGKGEHQKASSGHTRCEDGEGGIAEHEARIESISPAI